MMRIDPNTIEKPYLHRLLLGGVAPRPIAFASTIDSNGTPNLSPFSFYNVFGVNPTTLIFSPSRRGRDNSTKHTFENLQEVPEVVINAVSYDMVQQMSLSSTEYAKGVNEFVKTGLTAVPSETIRPFRVKESPMQMECMLREIIETGNRGGAGNLVICEIKLIHLNEEVLDENKNIHPDKIDLVGRLGGDYYVRASGEAIFQVAKPLANHGIGVDALPKSVQHSKFLTGNDLGQLGNLEKMPSNEEIEKWKNHLEYTNQLKPGNMDAMHQLAKQLISEGRVFEALLSLMVAHT